MRMTRTNGRTMSASLKGAALAVIFSTSAAAAAENAIRIALSSPPTTLDPHFHNLTPNSALSMHVFEPLFRIDEKSGRAAPGLAKSWEAPDERTWIVNLAEGVTFSNGKPFTANDVIYSICRIPTIKDSPGSFMGQIQAVENIEALSPHQIRITTKGPYPILPVDLADVMIVSAETAGAGAVTFGLKGCNGFVEGPTDKYNSTDLAVGTGPFKYTSFVPGEKIDLVANDKYREGKAVWDKVTLRIIPNDVARVAALLSHEVDLIERPPLQDLSRIKANDKLAVTGTVSERIIYLAFDVEQEPTPGIKGTDGKNPFKDKRVREAVTHAISRDVIVEKVMRDQAQSAGQLLSPGSFGYFETGFAPDSYDPEKAKALLSEAGYPNGFELVIGATNNRYVNDARIAETLAQMLTRVGIKTSVDASNFSIFSEKRNKYQFSSYLGGWGNGSREGIYTFRSLVATRNTKEGMGSSNRGRFSNAKVDNLLREAQRTNEEGKRLELFRKIAEIVKEEKAILPLHYEMATWAHSADIAVQPSADQRTVASRFSPKP
ncbi:peptide ABC transporter substrate-binding protein [Microvirga sp. 17 mud 1-3]|nr:peptide ABC transporter substrate-binding protein [Microvirga sp. 17 mud 1-3]